jgi:NTP pyrophosphatase (non-canonical NTP hydrolase)
MNINEYQESIKQFAIYPGAGEGGFPEVNYLLLGLVSEAGELAGKWKKFVRDGTFNQEDFLAEIGDVLWYTTQLCSSANLSIEAVAELNYNKLSKRKETNTLKGSGDHREQEAVASAVAS